MIEYKVEVDDAGIVCWYNNKGQVHCEHGPAIECSDGAKFWYLNDCRYSEENWKKELGKRNVKELTAKQISDLLGYAVKVVE